jgi:predicted kinase
MTRGERTGVGTLVATIGPPGAGKSTWRRHHQRRDVALVSLDDNRALVSCCSANQQATPVAVEIGVATARAVLGRGATLIWDATNADRAARTLLQVLAAEYAAHTVAVVFLPPLAICLARNASRDPRPCSCGYARRVPDTVIRSMHDAIHRDLPDLPGEGWHTVQSGPDVILDPPCSRR